MLGRGRGSVVAADRPLHLAASGAHFSAASAEPQIGSRFHSGLQIPVDRRGADASQYAEGPATPEPAVTRADPCKWMQPEQIISAHICAGRAPQTQERMGPRRADQGPANHPRCRDHGIARLHRDVPIAIKSERVRNPARGQNPRQDRPIVRLVAGDESDPRRERSPEAAIGHILDSARLPSIF